MLAWCGPRGLAGGWACLERQERYYRAGPGGGVMGGIGPRPQAGQGAAGGPISPMTIPTSPGEHNPDAAISGTAG